MKLSGSDWKFFYFFSRESSVLKTKMSKTSYTYKITKFTTRTHAQKRWLTAIRDAPRMAWEERQDRWADEAGHEAGWQRQGRWAEEAEREPAWQRQGRWWDAAQEAGWQRQGRWVKRTAASSSGSPPAKDGSSYMPYKGHAKLFLHWNHLNPTNHNPTHDTQPYQRTCKAGLQRATLQDPQEIIRFLQRTRKDEMGQSYKGSTSYRLPLHLLLPEDQGDHEDLRQVART